MRPLISPPGFLVGCSLISLLVGCGPSSTSPSKGASTEVAWQRPPAPPRQARERDQRISADNLLSQLTPYIESIGAGFGPGYQPTGFVSVSAAGEAIYERGFGYADSAAERPNTADTSFRIGAITKQFTAAAILLLAAAGKLSLDDTIAQHVPEYPSVGAQITLHQLLSHTAGLPNYLTDAALLQRRSEALTPMQLLELFWNEPLEFAPGSDFRYSDSGYAVLGVIIERVTGKTYAEHMQRELFGPFGLEHTTLGDDLPGAELALGYSASETGELQLAQGFHSSILYAAAGIRSSAHDLLLWHDALQNGEVLPAAQEKALFTPVLNDYAYGWFVRESHGVKVVSHAGAVAGFVSHFARVPELDLAVVVLSNNSAVDANPIAEAALGAALGDKIEPRRKATSVALEPEVVQRMTGTYRLSDAAAAELKARKIPKQTLQAMRSIRLYEENAKLYFKASGQSAVPMTATGPASFVLLGGKAKIQVELDSNGSPATRLLLEQGPLRLEFTRRARVRGKKQEPEVEEL
jgi:CubicO group peptidase (beta-lactamase class C family)